MAYVKPGVEIKQVQATAAPILNPADLPSVIVGPGYYVHPYSAATTAVGGDTAILYSGVSVDVALNLQNADYNTVVSADEAIMIVDLVGVSGSKAGEILHLTNVAAGYEYSAGVVTVGGSSITDWNTSTSEIHISYRTFRSDINKYQTINSTSEIAQKIGEPVSYNPLAFGVMTAINNAGSAIGAFGAKTSAGLIPAAADYTAAMDDLLLEDVYACAYTTHLDIEGNMKTAVEAASVPAVKRERIAILNQQIPATGYYRGQGGDADKGTMAGAIRDQNSAHNSKRVVMTHPDIVYIEESRHVSTVDPTWINKSFSNTDAGTYSDFGAYGAYAKFAGTTTVGTKSYYYWDDITAAVQVELVAAGVKDILVFAPVPGWAYACAIAGQSAGLAPEQPFTNMPVAGLSKTYGSQDYFTDANLNTMAGGGTYVMTQKSPAAPIVSRHQVSTNVTSIAKRELSITRAVDYSAKFIRQGLEPYIGRYNITPAFLKLFNSVLVAQGLFLTRNGIVNDVKIASVKVDETAPDTILADIEILVKYPVNYIKIQLLF
jgi:hypothetical protein